MNYKKQKEVKIDNKSTHLKWFAVIFLILILLLVFRIFWLQFIDGSSLKERAYKQITANRVLSPKRGTIYDSTGKALAVSSEVDTISVNPSLIAVKNDAEATNALKEKVAKALSDIFELDYNEVLVKVTKNKVAPPFKEARFNIMYGTGISKEGEILDLAIELQICKKSGAWFSYGDTKLGQGKINVENLLKENKELFEEIKAKVLEKLNVNNNKVSEE